MSVSDWQQQLREAYTSPRGLLEHLGLAPDALPYRVDLSGGGFRTLVPRAFAERMAPGDPFDPLLRQVLPLAVEADEVPGFGPDPLGEQGALAGPGMIRRFAGRALVVATGACAVNCRYCFRRGFPYADLGLRRSERDRLVAEVRRDTSLHEVILSGGDPLVLPDADLADLLGGLAAVDHVRGLRIHTRVPVVLPDRVTDRLLETLSGLSVPAVVVLHANHPRELGPGVRSAAARLAGAVTALLNQSVLLAGVNDSADVLEGLSWALLSCGVLPYYVHLLDAAAGTAHFEVGRAEAAVIEGELRRRLPGYLVPRFVRDGPDLEFKTPIGA